MATVHVGANADPHRASFWLAPPEGWLVPAEGRRASTTPYVLTHRAGRLRVAVTPIRDRTTDTGRGKSVSKCPRTRGHIDMGHRPEVPVEDASTGSTQQTRDVVRDVTSAESCHGSSESD